MRLVAVAVQREHAVDQVSFAKASSGGAAAVLERIEGGRTRVVLRAQMTLVHLKAQKSVKVLLSRELPSQHSVRIRRSAKERDAYAARRSYR